MNASAVKLLVAGDLCPGDHYFTLGHGFADPARVEKALTAVASLLKSADLSLANLECPLGEPSRDEPPFAGKAFLGRPEVAVALKNSGITHLHVANNHILQHGLQAFQDTTKALKAAGITPVGDSGATAAISPRYLCVRGLKLAIVAVSLVHDPFLCGERAYDHPGREELLEFVQQVSGAVDHLLISIHWGSEGPDTPSSFEVDLGRKLVEAGASIVLGHHPHVIRPFEIWSKGLICYSLGNFLFDLDWHYPYSIGVLLEIELGAKGTCPGWKPHFFRCNNGVIRVLPDEAAAAIERRLSSGAIWLRSSSPRDIDARHDLLLKRLPAPITLKKLFYFLRMLPRGETLLKISFLLNKLNMKKSGLGLPASSRE